MVAKSEANDVEVRVRSTAEQREIPEWLGARLRLGANRTERLRRDIAVQGGLPDLPPVEVFPEVWRLNGDLVLGTAGAIERGGRLHLTIGLSAPSAVQSDDELLRSILLVQFFACITSLARSGTKNSPLSLRRLVDPTAWFGSNDAARVKSWVGGRVDGLEVIAGLLTKSLATVEPPADHKLVDVHLPDWVRARVALGQDRSSSIWSAKDGQL